MSSSALPRPNVPASLDVATSESTSDAMYSLPFVLILGYVLVDFGRPHNWVPILGYLRPGVIVLGGGILAMLIKRPAIPTLGKWVLAFLGLMMVLAPFAYNNRMAVVTTKDFALMTVGAILPIMCFVDTFERFRKLLRFWVWIHVPLALYSITHRGFGIGFSHHSGPSLSNTARRSSTGTGSDPPAPQTWATNSTIACLAGPSRQVDRPATGPADVSSVVAMNRSPIRGTSWRRLRVRGRRRVRR